MSSFEEQSTNFKAEERANTNETNVGVKNEYEWGNIDGSSGEEIADRKWSDIPSFDMIAPAEFQLRSY